MRQQEFSEIRRRAALILGGSIASLNSELRSLHARNAAKGCLRSGATVKESACIAEGIIRSYFQQLEAYVRELPLGGVGTDAKIIDSVSDSTRKLLEQLWVSLKKTAALASNEKLVVHIQPQIEVSLAAAQEAFRSNLRAYWAKREASLPKEPRLFLVIELMLFATSLALAVAWIFYPTGLFEAWIVLFGLGGGAIEHYRRSVRGGAP